MEKQQTSRRPSWIIYLYQMSILFFLTLLVFSNALDCSEFIGASEGEFTGNSLSVYFKKHKASITDTGTGECLAMFEVLSSGFPLVENIVTLDTKNSQYDQYWKVFPEDVAFDMAVSYDFDANKGNNISSCITTFPDYFSLKTTGYLSCSEVQSIHEALYDDDDKFVSTVVLTILKYLAILMVLFTIFFVSCIYYKFGGKGPEGF